MANVPIFLDTAYIYALINTRDQWHEQAVTWQQRLENDKFPLITTEHVLVEIGNGLSSLRFRQKAVQIINSLQHSPLVEVIPATTGHFELAFKLFQNRSDKDWGMTDCFSFIMMEKRSIRDALTTDIHFRQAGFNALLLD